MKYFLDACISPKFAAMLNALEHGEVTALREHFSQNAKDLDWIPELGRHGWTLISVDRRQTRDPAERKALRDAGAVAFYLAKGFENLKFLDQAAQIVKVWGAILNAAERTSRAGQCYLIRMNGTIEIMTL